MGIAEFVKTINSLRLANKNTWYQWSGEVEGKTVEIKGYGTWLQIFRIDGVRYGGLSDQKVGEFKTCLKESIERSIETGQKF